MLRKNVYGSWNDNDNYLYRQFIGSNQHLVPILEESFIFFNAR